MRAAKRKKIAKLKHNSDQFPVSGEFRTGRPENRKNNRDQEKKVGGGNFSGK